jgi:hypothetical protein
LLTVAFVLQVALHSGPRTAPSARPGARPGRRRSFSANVVLDRLPPPPCRSRLVVLGVTGVAARTVGLLRAVSRKPRYAARSASVGDRRAARAAG